MPPEITFEQLKEQLKSLKDDYYDAEENDFVQEGKNAGCSPDNIVNKIMRLIGSL